MSTPKNTSLFQGSLVNSNRIIYTPSPFAKASLLHLQEVGSLQAQKPHTSRRKNLMSLLFFIVEKGSGNLHYNGEDFTIKQGDCVFLDCSKPYSHCSSEDLWQLKWVHFYGPGISAIYEKYVQRGGLPCFSSHRPENYSLLMTDMFQIASSDDHVRDMRINEKLASLLTLLMEESRSFEGGNPVAYGKRNMTEIRAFLDEHYTEKVSLDELSVRFYINKFYLTRLFKEQFGVPISTYLLSKRITRAKELLRFTDNSIEKIALECGMNDANYFSRMFKKVEGISPGEYRKKW